MLIKCPECEMNVSEKAILCPHCGYPFKPEKISPRKSNRKKRLPNGFGQISFIKGNLRKPYRAMVSIGKSEVGRPISKLLSPVAYFETYNQAYEALMKYHLDPRAAYDNTTMDQLFDMWSEVAKQDLSGGYRMYSSSWAYASYLYDLKVRDVHVAEIERCYENCNRIADGKVIEATPVVKSWLKTVLNQMFDFAVARDMTDKNYARMYHLPKNITRQIDDESDLHDPFTNDEVEKLVGNLNVGCAKMIYIQCYSGWRPSELLGLRVEDVDLNEGTMLGGSKTDAGKNRVVPIHSKILPLVTAQRELAVNLESEYLFCDSEGKLIRYERYRRWFESTLQELGIREHRPHDPRKTFVTKAKQAKVDNFAIKYMVGHKIIDITERVYTKREIDWLKEEIEKIK